MLLHKIVLENFGAYRGKQSLDVAPTGKKPIVLIGGLNGCGKTTLLDAVQLTLYGPRARCSGRGNKAYETYLRECINRQADPSRGSAVSLEFTVVLDGREHYYRVVRSWHTSGKSLKEFLNVYIDEEYGDKKRAGGNAVPEGRFNRLISEGWPDHVEDLLPLEIASLSFFDGEKIESLADPDRAASVIESAINSLLGVNTVQQLRTDLLALQRRQKLSDEEQHIMDAIHALESERDSVQDTLEAAQHELDERRRELTAARRRLETLERAFEKEGGGFFERRVELEAEQKRTAERLAEVRSALAQVAAGPLPLLMLRGRIERIREQAVREREAVRAGQVLEVLAERDRWLLDLLPEGSREAVLEELRADRERRATAAELAVDYGLPSDALAQLAVLDEVLVRDQSRAAELVKLAIDTAEHAAQLDRQLAGVPEKSQVKALQSARAEQLQEVAVLQSELDRSAAQLTELRRRREGVLASLSRAHDDFVRMKVKVEEVERVIRYSEKARETLNRFGEALLRRHITRLEVAVLQSFKELMRKQGLVRDLRIDTTKFTLTLSDADGETIDPGRLSAGERQLLAVSLLWGLMKVAGNRLPSIIDTPLGRLDSKHREHLVDRYFPHASDQVLLLSTDEEIDIHLLARLERFVARKYMLVHDDEEFTTRVAEGYFWNKGAMRVA